jgi:hypothetical protein
VSGTANSIVARSPRNVVLRREAERRSCANRLAQVPSEDEQRKLHHLSPVFLVILQFINLIVIFFFVILVRSATEEFQEQHRRVAVAFVAECFAQIPLIRAAESWLSLTSDASLGCVTGGSAGTRRCVSERAGPRKVGCLFPLSLSLSLSVTLEFSLCLCPAFVCLSIDLSISFTRSLVQQPCPVHALLTRQWHCVLSPCSFHSVCSASRTALSPVGCRW